MGTALPVAAATNANTFDAVQQLLLLERLQAAFYTQALAALGLIPSTQTADFQRMLGHQTQHAALLLLAVQNAGAQVPPLPAFDFSGRRGVATNPVLFPNVLSNYDDFLALAQQLEDLGVRLYNTHALAITDDGALSRAVLRMLPVEGEHSAHVRGLRRSRGVAVKPWPSATDAAISRPPAAQALTTAATGGEDNLVQYRSSGVKVPFSDLLTVFKLTFVRDASIAEAFDEPLSNATAQAALDLFS